MKRKVTACHCGEHAFVRCTRGLVALIDVCDTASVAAWNWTGTKTGYAARGDGRATTHMHTQILGRVDGYEVDHIDGNGMNNRRGNLRHVTKAQNQMNRHAVASRSGFKGVTANRHNWSAAISKRDGAGVRRRRYLGTYQDAVHAALAYDAAAREEFGPWARTNFPQIAPEFFGRQPE